MINSRSFFFFKQEKKRKKNNNQKLQPVHRQHWVLVLASQVQTAKKPFNKHFVWDEYCANHKNLAFFFFSFFCLERTICLQILFFWGIVCFAFKLVITDRHCTAASSLCHIICPPDTDGSMSGFSHLQQAEGEQQQG